MVKELPVLRCPCCGKLSLFPNFIGFHKLEAFSLTIRGLGKGKGFRNTYTHATIKGDLISYWVRRLKEVIKYLESLQPKSQLSITQEKPSLLQLSQQGRLSYPSTVSGISVSTKTESLSLPSQKTQILIAQDE